MDVHPSNDLHTCKMECEDDSESEIIQLLNNLFSITYNLDRSKYSRADIVDVHPINDLNTCKMEHEDDSESEIIQLLK